MDEVEAELEMDKSGFIQASWLLNTVVSLSMAFRSVYFPISFHPLRVALIH